MYLIIVETWGGARLAQVGEGCNSVICVGRGVRATGIFAPPPGLNPELSCMYNDTMSWTRLHLSLVLCLETCIYTMSYYTTCTCTYNYMLGPNCCNLAIIVETNFNNIVIVTQIDGFPKMYIILYSTLQ